jgi:Ni/Co efflux regulator RcnB
MMRAGFANASLALKENNMHRGSRFLSSLFLTAALAAPMAMMAAATPQDDKNHDKQDHKRYYDKHHKDYHTWDDNEDRSYQRYQTEHHEKRAFIQLNTQQQTVYWDWRHNNPDVR